MTGLSDPVPADAASPPAPPPVAPAELIGWYIVTVGTGVAPPPASAPPRAAHLAPGRALVCMVVDALKTHGAVEAHLECYAVGAGADWALGAPLEWCVDDEAGGVGDGGE